MSKELQAALTAFVNAITALVNLELANKVGTEKAKGKKPAPVEEESFDESGDVDAEESTEEDSSDEDTDAGGDEEEGEEEKSLEDVIDAIKTYVGKNKNGEKDKAVALLKKKFKTGNVNKLESKDYAAAIALFSKK